MHSIVKKHQLKEGLWIDDKKKPFISVEDGKHFWGVERSPCEVNIFRATFIVNFQTKVENYQVLLLNENELDIRPLKYVEDNKKLPTITLTRIHAK